MDNEANVDEVGFGGDTVSIFRSFRGDRRQVVIRCDSGKRTIPVFVTSDQARRLAVALTAVADRIDATGK